MKDRQEQTFSDGFRPGPSLSSSSFNLVLTSQQVGKNYLWKAVTVRYIGDRNDIQEDTL